MKVNVNPLLKNLIKSMNYETFNIFPTTIYLGEIDNHKKYKEDFYKVYNKFDYDDQNTVASTVSEGYSDPLIHLEPELETLFEEIVNHIKIYVLDVMKYKDIFNYIITKTWLSRSRNPQMSIPWHTHSTSHISFTYYINMPPNSHHIMFADSSDTKSFFAGINRQDKHGFHDREMVKEYNSNNARSFSLNPPEGSIILFPSSTRHGTKGNVGFDGERLAIVGDVILTLKEDQLQFSMGYIDPKYWRIFN